jgi:hypothetical protein
LLTAEVVDEFGKGMNPVSEKIFTYTPPDIRFAWNGSQQVTRVDANTGNPSPNGQAFTLPIHISNSDFNGKNPVNSKVQINVGGVDRDCVLNGELYTVKGATLEIDKAYKITVTAWDALGSSSKVFTIPAANYIMFFSEDGKGIGIGTSDIPAKSANAQGVVAFNPNWDVYIGGKLVKP